MSNAILGGSAPEIPQYVADGYSGSGSTRTLTFSAGAPPTDGSIGIATVVLNVPALGFSYSNGAYQRLLYWADHTVPGGAAVTGVSGITNVQVPNWAFVADAS